MTIVQISDTHNRHRQLANLPAADVLVHCGDFTDMGTEQELSLIHISEPTRREWLSRMPSSA